MNEEVYATALKTALAEIKNVCPDVNNAYVLFNDGNVVSSSDQVIDSNVEKAMTTLQELTEKSSSLGGLNDLVIDGDKGKVYVSQVNGTYSVMALSKRADLTFLRTITNIVFPTVLKVLEGISPETLSPTPLKSTSIIPQRPMTPAPLEPEIEEEKIEEPEAESERFEEPEEIVKPKLAQAQEDEEEAEQEVEEEVETITELPAQKLIVDKFGGLMVRSDTVQLDSEVLDKWASALRLDEIHEVDIETFRGKTVRCKVKVISDEKLQGRGIVRIPEKTCDALELTCC
jgi:predicted regulator of Ras-like GTPase activity (Roadblock/LC7/MglB family)